MPKNPEQQGQSGQPDGFGQDDGLGRDGVCHDE